MKYVPTIGLEIHAELKTRTKMFCGCANNPDEKKQNTNICPICMGHPGTLPTVNKEAVKNVLRVGVALKAKIADFTEWDRKHYFYPDIPKGYQISQYKYPLVSGGSLKGIEITRIHLEEDTGTLIHADISSSVIPAEAGIQKALGPRLHGDDKTGYSFVDYNRAGVPLMELVTEPVIHDAKTAGDFARELQLVFRYLGVSDANMEKGEMRVEANISVAKPTEIADRRGLDTQMHADGNTGKLLYEDLSYKIRGAAFSIINELGSGHKELVYQKALEEEFKKGGVIYEKEKVINVIYDGKKVGVYRPDFVIDGKVILEIKAVSFVGEIERKQLWHYLKSYDYKLALLINFGSKKLQIERVVLDSIRVNPRLGNPRASAFLGTKVEVKNLNSFRVVEKAIEYEIERQTAVLEAGEKVVQETRGWDEGKQKTFSQRKKEESHDYRYFPEPDIPKFKLGEIQWAREEFIRKTLPELPEEKRERYASVYGIKNEDIEIYVAGPELGKFFEEVANKLGVNKKAIALASNYIISDVVGMRKTMSTISTSASISAENLRASAFFGKLTPESFAKLIVMIEKGLLSSRGAKDTLAKLIDEGGEPGSVAKAIGVIQIHDGEAIKKVVKKIISENEKVVGDYKGGKVAALQFLVGQVMKETRGAASPNNIKDILTKLLD